MFRNGLAVNFSVGNIFVRHTRFWEYVQVPVLFTPKHPMKNGEKTYRVRMPVDQGDIANEVGSGILQFLTDAFVGIEPHIACLADSNDRSPFKNAFYFRMTQYRVGWYTWPKKPGLIAEDHQVVIV